MHLLSKWVFAIMTYNSNWTAGRYSESVLIHFPIPVQIKHLVFGKGCTSSKINIDGVPVQNNSMFSMNISFNASQVLKQLHQSQLVTISVRWIFLCAAPTAATNTTCVHCLVEGI